MSFDPEDDKEEPLFEIDSDASDDEENRSPDESDAEVIAEKASKAARKLEPIVLAHVLGAKYQPVKPRVIAKQLKLPSEQHKALKLAIRRLVKAGKLVYGSGHLVRRPPGTKPKASDAPAQKSRGKGKALTPPLSREEKESRSGESASTRESKNVVIGKFDRQVPPHGEGLWLCPAAGCQAG
jgi:hypothetical protein